MKFSARKGLRGITAITVGILMLNGCDPYAVRLSQFTVQGKQLYMENCSQCHQVDGKGLSLLYPPLADEELLSHTDRIACAIRYGVSGPKEIGGKIFNQPMAAVEILTDLEIAEIITFLTTTWGGHSQLTDADTVRQLVNKCR